MKKISRISLIALPLLAIILIAINQYSRDIKCYIKYWSHENTAEVCTYFYKE
jgi:hypothetical protein